MTILIILVVLALAYFIFKPKQVTTTTTTLAPETTTTTLVPETTTTTLAPEPIETVNWVFNTLESGIGGITITKNGINVVSSSVSESGSFVVNDGDGIICTVSATPGHTSVIHVGAGPNNIYNDSIPDANVGYAVTWHPIYDEYNLTFVGTIS